MIGWSKNRLGLPSAPLHYGLTWPVGIPTVFQTPVTVPLHCNCLPLGLCKGTVKESTVVSHGRLLHNSLNIYHAEFFPEVSNPHSLIKPRKCQLTIIEAILLARNYKIQQSNETQSQFAHYITMVPLTDSMQSFSPRCLSPHSLIKQKKISTHYNWNCFASQKLQNKAKQWNPRPFLHIT